MMLDFGDYFRKALKFMIIGAIGALINWGLLYFFVQYLNVWYLTAEIVATIIVFGVNFNGNILVKNIKIRKSQEIVRAPDPLRPEDVGK